MSTITLQRDNVRYMQKYEFREAHQQDERSPPSRIGKVEVTRSRSWNADRWPVAFCVIEVTAGGEASMKGIAGRQTRGLPTAARLHVADNTAKVVQIINVLSSVVQCAVTPLRVSAISRRFP